MLDDKYTLDDAGQPVLATDLLSWARWLESAERHVGNDRIGEAHVSTVFLGLDHSFAHGEHVPILWETMIFGGEHDQYQERYASREEAIAGHKRAVDLVKTEKSI